MTMFAIRCFTLQNYDGCQVDHPGASRASRRVLLRNQRPANITPNNINNNGIYIYIYIIIMAYIYNNNNNNKMVLHLYRITIITSDGTNQHVPLYIQDMLIADPLGDGSAEIPQGGGAGELCHCRAHRKCRRMLGRSHPITTHNLLVPTPDFE